MPSCRPFAAALLALALALPALGEEVLLEEHFQGAALDPAVWLLPEGAGTFFGRTQIRAPSLPPSVGGGVLRLALDTHNPTALVPGDSFLGSEIRTRRSFHPGAGWLAFEAAMRFVDDEGVPVPAGVVGALFGFETDGFVRDEIDVELLSNDLRLARGRFLTNVFQDDDFGQPGRKAFAELPGLSLDGFHLYRVEWSLGSVRWLVDGVVVREESVDLPDEPLDVRLNVWVPDAGFAEAYHAGLQPTHDPAANRTWYLEVDEVRVLRVPEAPDALAGPVGLIGTGLLAGLARGRSRFAGRLLKARAADDR